VCVCELIMSLCVCVCVCVRVRVFVCTGSSWASGEGFGDNMRACVRRGAWDVSVTRDVSVATGSAFI